MTLTCAVRMPDRAGAGHNPQPGQVRGSDKTIDTGPHHMNVGVRATVASLPKKFGRKRGWTKAVRGNLPSGMEGHAPRASSAGFLSGKHTQKEASVKEKGEGVPCLAIEEGSDALVQNRV